MAIPSFLNRSNIAAALQGLSVGLMGYGSGNPNAGLLAVGAVGDEKRRREQSELQRMEMERLQRQDAAEAAKETERKARVAAARAALDRLLGGVGAGPSMTRQGPGPARFPGQPAAGGFGGGMNITPQQAAVMQGLEPQDALALLGKQAFETPEAPEWKITTVREGNQDVTYRINPTTGVKEKLGAGAAFAPTKPDIIDEWEPYTDPLSGRTGQKNKRTGKIDWDPGNTVLTQVGTDAQGNPIMEMQSISGKKANGKPPTESEQKAAQLFTRTSQQLPILDETWSALTNLNDQIASGVLPGAVENFATSPEYQRAKNALTDIAASYLYSVSGAQAPEQEVERTVNAVMPKPGESPASVADKKARIDGYVASIKLKMKPGMIPDVGIPAGPLAPDDPANMSDEDLLKALGQ